MIRRNSTERSADYFDERDRFNASEAAGLKKRASTKRARVRQERVEAGIGVARATKSFGD
eukprot:766427-Hanusia_phi.AAC.7